MTQPPEPPDENQPYDPSQQPSQQSSQQSSQQNDWITSSSQSAGRPEDTQQLPPHGRGSAGQPYAGAYSQPSGGNPYNQPYQQPPAGAPYQQSQPYNPNQPPAGPPGAGMPQFGGWQAQAPQQPRRRALDANPLRAAFDFSFKSYATPGLAKIVYIIAIVLGVVWWIGGAIYWFRVGAAINHLTSSISGAFGGGGSDGGANGFTTLGILSLVLGWIPVALWIFLVRAFLEAAIAMVRTAGDARSIREKVDV